MNAPTQIQAEVAIIAYHLLLRRRCRAHRWQCPRERRVLPAGVREGIAPTEWLPIGPDHNNQVDNALLENFDTTGLTDDVYTLQLQVVGGDGQIRQSSIQLTVDNTPPRSISPIRPQSRSSCQVRVEWVNVNAEVADIYAVARVEFFVNGQAEPFAVRSIAPFNVNWPLGGPGRYQFHVVVYDGAGNKAETEPVTVSVVARQGRPLKAILISQDPDETAVLSLALQRAGLNVARYRDILTLCPMPRMTQTSLIVLVTAEGSTVAGSEGSPCSGADTLFLVIAEHLDEVHTSSLSNPAPI